MPNTQTKILFYEIPSALPNRQVISPFTNTVRFALEYKRLQFTAEYIELADIEKKAAELGIPATGTKKGPDGTRVPLFTLPAIIDSTNGEPVLIVDSFKIIQYLEKTYPDPERPLFPGFPDPSVSTPALYLLADQHIGMSAMFPGFPLIAEDVYKVHTEHSKDFWKANFLRNWGGAPDFKDVCPQKGTEAHEEMMKKFVTGFEGVADAISNNATSSSDQVGFLMGSKPTFPDLKLRAMLNIIKLSSPDTWSQLKGIKEGFFDKYFDQWNAVL